MPKHRVWRVSGEPPSFDKASLAEALRHNPTLLCPTTTGRDGEGRGSAVQVDTLAPDLQSLEQVATVRFPMLPPLLQMLESKSQLTIEILAASDDEPMVVKRIGSSQ